MCALNQSKALYEISTLLKELENVEELYPSGRALGQEYPLYGSSAFNDRIKAMCLWYNVTCLLQLKIDIIGHMLVSLGSKGLPWPTWPAWPQRSEGIPRASLFSQVFFSLSQILYIIICLFWVCRRSRHKGRRLQGNRQKQFRPVS